MDGMDMQQHLTGTWRNIRMELARTPEFPEGSASRAYIVHLPLREDGTVDERVLEVTPVMAGFKRFWPNEPDRSGLVVRDGNGWALSCTGADGREWAVPIEMDRLLPGDRVTIGKQGGGCWLFRVVDLQIDSAAPR